MKITKIITKELEDYESNSLELSSGVFRSAYKRLKRISFFLNKGGEKDKIDEFGQYKYWMDPAKTAIDSTIKNLRIDTKNFLVFSSDPVGDFSAVYVANLALRNNMFDDDRDIQLKEDIDYFANWGNCLWRKIQDGYELCDLTNVYILNQGAKTIDDSAVIERHEITQSELKEMEGEWDNISDVIKDCKNKSFFKTRKVTEQEQTNAIYEIFIRNGEVSEKVLFEAQGKDGGDENKFIFSRIVTAGLEKNNEKGKSIILYAEKFPKKNKMSDYYKEAHFGSYQGTWLREGIYEQLFDYLVAIREIDNSIQEGLDWASTVVFKSSDNQTFTNIRTDIENGRIIRSKDLSQVDVRLHNLDQLIARRSNLLEEISRITNSFEIVQGEAPPSGTPFASLRQLNENANKFFTGIKQKFTIPYKHIYKEWELPRIIKRIKSEDLIRITGDENIVSEFRKIAVDSWYQKNLAKIGPHDASMKEQIKIEKFSELEKYDPMIKNISKIWNGILKRLNVTIDGEEIDFSDNLQTLTALLPLEQDPFRRAFVLDKIYAIKGIPIPPAQPPQPMQSEPQNVTGSDIKSLEKSNQ